MLLGLVCAVGTSVCYGIGSALQAVAAGQADGSDGVDPRLLLRLARSWRYVVGLGLDGVGFLLSLVALQVLPLYVVQAIVASSLAVAAVAAVVLVGADIGRAERIALLAVVGGLALVGLSGSPEAATRWAGGAQLMLVAGSVALVLLTLVVGRLGGTAGSAVLGGIAGVAFGVVATAARALSAVTGGGVGEIVAQLLRSPASYAVLVAAPLALVTYATALQRGSVVQATAPLVVGETVLPAVLGLAFLGDHARPGWGPAALVGFVVAVGAALVLSRFGEVEPPDAAAGSGPGGGG